MTTHNPNNPNIFPTITKCFDILKISDETSNIFKNTKIRQSKKQPKNLKKLLTKAKFETEKTKKEIIRCNRPRCKTCPDLIVGTDIKMENGQTFTINDTMTCTSKNLIYMLLCNGCTKT
jgi:ribosomal protein S19